MNMDSYRIECETCDWYCENADRGSVAHAGYVHSTMLKRGHTVGRVATRPGGWVR